MGKSKGMTVEDAAQIESEFTPEPKRAIVSHRVVGEMYPCPVDALGERGGGGANMKYRIGDSTVEFLPHGAASNEGLIATVIDRLEGFQTGPGACGDNNVALVGLRDAMKALKRRTAFLVSMRPKS